MSESREEAGQDRDENLAFFGRITASLSHEINNVLTIINELSGLMGDLLEASARGKPLNEDKLSLQREKISAQILRGEKLIKRLNRFSHLTDSPLKTFSLHELLEDLASIAERFATLKGVSLTLTLPETEISIENNPFEVQKTVFAAIDAFLTSAASDAAIELDYAGEPEQAIISVGCASGHFDRASLALTQERIIGFCENLGAKTEFSEQDKRCIIKILLPLQIPA